MAKGRRRNITNKNQDHSPSSEPSTPTSASPGHHNTPENLDLDLNLTCVLATGQEERSKPESSATKLYCLHLQEQEARARAREQECKRFIAYIFRSQRAREQESKKGEMAKPRPL